MAKVETKFIIRCKAVLALTIFMILIWVPLAIGIWKLFNAKSIRNEYRSWFKACIIASRAFKTGEQQ